MAKVRYLNESCNICGKRINSWDKRISKTLTYRYPCCESCIAAEYDGGGFTKSDGALL